MTPDKAGIWEWFDGNGIKRLVQVCNVAEPIAEVRLRVYWWGGYYDVCDRVEDIYRLDGTVARKDVKYPAEWPDRWGNYVGEIGSVHDADLHLAPTPEEKTQILNLEWKH